MNTDQPSLGPAPLIVDFARSNKAAIACFALASVWLLALHIWHGITFYPFDSNVYWTMATTPETLPASWAFRGYLYPWLMRLVITVGEWVGLSPVFVFRILSSLVYAAVLALLVPNTYARVTGRPVSLGARLAVAGVLPLLFPGLVLFPLSDLPACAFMWLSVWCLLRSRDGRPLLWLALAGAAAAAAYNTRTIYLYPALIVAAVMLWQLRSARLAAFFVLGAAVIALPQVPINQRIHGIASVDPAAGMGGGSLFALQLKWGLSIQKYETSLSPQVPAGSVFYRDDAGKQLMLEVCRDGPLATVPDYIGAVLRHPVGFAGLYTRHLLNGLDVRDGMVFERDLSVGKSGLPAFILMLLLVLSLAVARARVRWGWAAVMVLPVVAILPGAVETRFMLPLFLLLLVAGAAEWRTGEIVSQVRRNAVGYLLLAGVLCGAFLAVTQSTAGSMQQTSPAIECPAR